MCRAILKLVYAKIGSRIKNKYYWNPLALLAYCIIKYNDHFHMT